MEPTALALNLAPSIREILQRIRATLHARPSFEAATAERRFRVMTSDYLVEVLLADVLRELAVAAPGIQMQILPSNAASFALFMQGEVDLIITPEDHTLPDHPRAELFEDTYSCVVWTDNRTVGDSITLEQYLSLSHVVVHVGHDQPSILERWLSEQAGKFDTGRRRVDVIAPGFGVIPHLVVGTERIGTMHTRHARFYERLLPVRVLDPPEGFPALREMMQWHRHLDSDPALRWLTEVLRRSAAHGTDAPS
jgi:DNA-binding transcriptional LysR family regulator